MKHLFLISMSFACWVSTAQTTQRNALVEDFSNAECSPCKTLSDELHPAVISMGCNEPDSNLNFISYQLNYPGYDPSYNIHAHQREVFYQMNGLPTLKANGKAINPMFNTAQYENIMDTSRDRPSQFILEGIYEIDEVNHLLQIKYDIIPLLTINGPFKVHTVVAERHYTNMESSIGMYEYYFVMRRMLPDGNGRAETSFTANIPHHIEFEVPYQVTNPPVSGGFDFWGNPLMSDLIVFLQDTVTREILQSQVFKPEMPTSIKEQDMLRNVLLYPNPAKDVLRLAFDTKLKGDAILTITNLEGKVLETRTHKQLIAGRHDIRMEIADLPCGTYLLQVQSSGVRCTKMFNVIR